MKDELLMALVGVAHIAWWWGLAAVLWQHGGDPIIVGGAVVLGLMVGVGQIVVPIVVVVGWLCVGDFWGLFLLEDRMAHAQQIAVTVLILLSAFVKGVASFSR